MSRQGLAPSSGGTLGRPFRLPDLGLMPIVGAAGLTLLAVLSGIAAARSPTLALIGVLALVFTCLLLADLTLGLTAFVVFQFFSVLPFASGQGLTLIKLAGAILFFTWIATLTSSDHRERAGGFLRAHPWLTTALAVFLLYGGLSYFWAPDPSEVVEAWQRYALNFILFGIAFAAIRTTRDLRIVVGGLVVGGAIAAVGGMLFVDPTAPGRLRGLVGQSNTIASQLTPVVILALGMAWTARRPNAKLLWGACAVAAVAGIVLSLARLGPVALAIGFAAWFAFGGRWRPRIAAVPVAIAVLGSFVFLAFAPEQQRTRLLEGDTTGSGRTDIWEVGTRAFQDHPLRGTGIGNWETVLPLYLNQPGLVERTDLIIDSPTEGHNIFLHVVVEAGLVGGALFFFVLLAALVANVKAARIFRDVGDRRAELLARANFGATIGYLGSALFVSAQYEKPLWILVGVGVALLAVARRARDAQRTDEPLVAEPDRTLRPALGEP